MGSCNGKGTEKIQKRVAPLPKGTKNPCHHEIPEVLTTVSLPTIAVLQAPDTSGLRLKTRQFMVPQFLENFIQSAFNTLIETKVPIEGGTLVVSGDGRYFNKEAIQTIIKMSFANGVGHILVGKDGLLSTPAVSAVIRTRKEKPFGGFILSASHNPGGIDEDFGIKYNCENGGPASEEFTKLIYEHSKKISFYNYIDDFPHIDIHTCGETRFSVNRKPAKVSVIDPTNCHVDVLKRCFDFNAIKKFISRKDFSMVYDSMCGVQGPYARKIFVEEFGLDESVLLNGEPKEDFGGPSSAHHGHADPNLTHARALVEKMGLTSTGAPLPGVDVSKVPSFGAAADGDADRNMILGSQFFVSPSDSLAVIAANADAIPYFKRAGGLKGCARSMPTSSALDVVAKEKGIPLFETPTGWKYFGSLMDTAEYVPFLCGEESFGTGSDHVREKDGMWAVLAWLQILAVQNPDESKPLRTVRDIVVDHWRKYGRHYYARYDYEGMSKPLSEKVMSTMGDNAVENSKRDEIECADSFSYQDPVDKEAPLAKNQGMRFLFKDGCRVVFRLSGTGVSGATIRLYLEKYTKDEKEMLNDPFEAVKGLAKKAMEFSKMAEIFNEDKNDDTGRCGLKSEDGICIPSVIT
eukprot:TRINITY_DN3726_c0_g1_i2.p1 TRINITY_DN3726_c0_g1~~TRINITY_DN3726_c0_g1_i2.p1  ORF type:complete len:633 (+),score=145.13 TRINITY_DN3726_c0_g1_i2:104-2002(+)